jgi:hypothetical protein
MITYRSRVETNQQMRDRHGKKLRLIKDNHIRIQPLETIESDIPLEMSKKRQTSLLIKR